MQSLWIHTRSARYLSMYKEAVIFIAAVLFVMGLLNYFSVEDRSLVDVKYCDMVSIYKQSYGENGWPDYKGNYEELCK